MYRNYLITALRHLFRHKTYSFINIAGLSFGLASAMLILLFIRDELSYDRFHKKGDQIYRVVRRMYNLPNGSAFASDGYTGLAEGPGFTAAIPGIKGFVRVLNDYRDIKKGTDIQSQQVLRVDSNFFTTFSFPLIAGNAATALGQPHTLVITEDFARREFGTTDALGKTMQVKTDSGFRPYTVTGVARKCPENSSIKFEAVTPIDVDLAKSDPLHSWFDVYLSTFVVLAPGADPHQIDAQIKRVYTQEEAIVRANVKDKAATNWHDEYVLDPLFAMHLSKDYPPIDGLTDASSPVLSYILSGIALFVLLIACINFVNLTIARSLRRAKEIGIRKVIGSSRQQLILRFLGESFFLCLIAFILAIGLVEALLPLFNTLSGKQLSLEYLWGPWLIAGFLALFVVTAFAAGFYPAIVLSSYDPVKTLYNRFTFGGRNLLQKSLVTVQFALASFLIMATGIIAAQFNFLIKQPLGYDDKNLVLVSEWWMSTAEYKSIAGDLRQSPDVVGVGGRNLGWYNQQARIDGTDIQVNTTIETIDNNYLPLLKIPLVAGRNFSPDYPADSTQSVLVNETFAREAGWKDPIGKTINVNDKTVRVIGMIKDHYFQPLQWKLKAQVFSLTLGRGIAGFFIKIRPNSEAKVLPFIEQTFKTRMPNNAYSFTFKDQENRANYESERQWKQIVQFGAIVTILISAIGLFGLSVFAAEKRIKEIGIRKVLGASVSGLVAGLSTDFLRLVLLALLISLPLARLAANKWLANYPYHVSLNIWLFAGTALLVVAIALITVGFQALKAALANPVESLRAD
jgi:putative ABC transport system permease protein